MKELQFIPFWKLTRWGWVFNFGFNRFWGALKLHNGCDEWHNPSRWITVPLVGQFVLFTIIYPRDTPEHLNSWSSGVYEGLDVPGCKFCEEFKREIEDE